MCCVGMWCPKCSMQLKIHVLGQEYIIDSSLKMMCEEKQFNINISATVQPGRYETQVSVSRMFLICSLKNSASFNKYFVTIIKVHRSFMNDSTIRRKYLGHITVNGKNNVFQSVYRSFLLQYTFCY